LAQQQAERATDERALAAERDQIRAAHERAEADHAALLSEIDRLRAQIDPAEAELQQEEQGQQDLEARERAATASLLDHEAQASRLSLEAQRAADRIEQIFERAVADGVALSDDGADDQPADDSGELLPTIDRLRDRILRIGVVNPLALEEFAETQTRQQFLSTQLDDLRQAGATLRELIAELEESMRQRFVATFSAVAAEFERSFTRLFGGGSATLQLVGGANGAHSQNGHEAAEASEERSFGIEIVARPPGKRQQNIALLSGGERALTASALLFAILTVNPSPFCILDEVDAALDESNVGRFREALSTLTDSTQFIVVTHNRGTIEVADTLYGVTMGDDGASKVLSLRVAEYVNAPEA
ncbi:AAA family ATPase, partial [Candidatus Gracilibacteria bacterium]|nr:AAA family ATPase [Candidatus Gracilibacteria bacterium]